MKTGTKDHGGVAKEPRPKSLFSHWRFVSRRWLYLGEDLILISVAVVMLAAGLFIVVDAVTNLVDALASHSLAPVIFGVAESALLALILAELVHSLLMSLEGRGLSPEPFLVIAIVAILRKMLVTSVQVSSSPQDAQGTTLVVGELLALALVIMILAVALVLIMRNRRSVPGEKG